MPQNPQRDHITQLRELPSVIRNMPTVPSAVSTSVSLKHFGGSDVCQLLEITLNNLAISITDPGGAAVDSGIQIVDMPEALLYILGGSSSVSVTAATGISATGTVNYAVGTTVASGTALATTEINVLPSAAITLAASVGTGTSVTASVGGFFDGTGTPVDLFFNVNIPDASLTANSSVTVSGTIYVAYVVCGDK